MFPTLIILFFLEGLFWELPALLTALCFLLSLLISRNIGRYKRIDKIRSGVKSRRKWMSLADYGASYGKIEKRSSKKKQASENVEDKWSYLKKVLEK